MSNRVPKIILKSLYESFRTADEAGAREKLALVEGLDIEEGLALAALARKARDFKEFTSLVEAAGSEERQGPLAAAKRLALYAAAESKFPWQSTEPVEPGPVPVPTS
ncbi:hypothetical protein ENSA5_23330 [Enhygromyxa salina]|uniref:Uncharacterized protein n=1 Tax=Enhygromyxa salina TaxID=215803 RepID=A0A2S9YBM1_9BACT|nr:hypothetical protein [Enhygromyxa salina]PRQ02406.1 hypothetical protein ENSA5_23330 [Enhygromyxa salina]